MPHAPTPDDDYILAVGLYLPSTDDIDLRLPVTLEQEFLAILDQESVSYSRVIELSNGALDWTAISVALSGRGLSQAIVAFMQRHKDKKVKVSLPGQTVEIKGYSAKEVGQLLESVAEVKEIDVEKWRRVAQQADPSEPTGD